ncbi:MAG: winged helix-turn-helix transcriptional regulator [Chloroflexi bacterium]|nr:winged helix-turn-helix transcriptional regulator [Chloroflexota bacterium]
MESTNDELRELSLLEQIESDPNVNQSALAVQLGVAVGTVNWHLKRLIAKGAVKVSRAERKKLRYIITPEGLALRARLAVDFVERSFSIRLSVTRSDPLTISSSPAPSMGHGQLLRNLFPLTEWTVTKPLTQPAPFPPFDRLRAGLGRAGG